MIMPFGKHQGQEIEDIESSYLRWFLQNVNDQPEDLYEAIEEELEARHERKQRT